MAIDYGGSQGLHDNKATHGLPMKWLTVWLGHWTRINADGTIPQLDQALAMAKARGVGLLIHVFKAGDQLGEPFVLGSNVADYDGTTKNLSQWWDLVKAMGPRIRVGGVPCAIDLEPEWADAGVLKVAPTWDTIWRNAAWTLKGAAPGTLLISTPGSWNNPWGSPGDTLVRFPGMMQTADIAGSQLVISKPTDPEYAKEPDLVAGFTRDLHAKTGKPTWLTDVAISSYAGSNSVMRPFAPIAPATVASNLLAGEKDQALALADLGDNLPDLEAEAGLRTVILRSWTNPSDEAWARQQFMGLAELGVGLVRADGTPKPALAAVKAWAAPVDPCAAIKQQLAAAQAALAASNVQRDAALARLEAVRQAGGWR